MPTDLITPEEIAFVRSKAITIDMVKILVQRDNKPVIGGYAGKPSKLVRIEGK